ncbi:hypothetical protein PV518_48075, partial [Streptomyces sp. ND04-05B]|uniref:hypothetical protein n=1 Tax=Streptomyces sp. ND04-05B TaxID=3028693 RepID=UPI00299FDFAB
MATDVKVTPPGVQVCSLKRELDELIQPGTTYQIVRFPFGSAEPYDKFTMHQIVQPDGYVIDSANWDADPRSGLIWPAKAGWGVVSAMFQWESSDATEYRDQLVRDPLGLGSPTPVDTTATDHRSTTPGIESYTKMWQLFVDPDTPLAVQV